MPRETPARHGSWYKLSPLSQHSIYPSIWWCQGKILILNFVAPNMYIFNLIRFAKLVHIMHCLDRLFQETTELWVNGTELGLGLLQLCLLENNWTNYDILYHVCAMGWLGLLTLLYSSTARSDIVSYRTVDWRDLKINYICIIQMFCLLL